MIRKFFFFTVIAVLLYLSVNAQQTTFRINYNIANIDIPGDMINDSNDDFVFAGTNASFFPYGNITKINPVGNIIWSKSVNASIATTLSDVIEVSNGGYLVAGDNVLIRLDINGNQIWSQSYDMPDISGSKQSSLNFNQVLESSDGNFLLAGSVRYFWDGTSSSTEDTTHCFAMKVNSTGGIMWDRTIVVDVPTDDEHGFLDVAETTDGYYFGGFSSRGDGTRVGDEDQDFYRYGIISKFGFNGNEIFTRRFGGDSRGDYIRSMITTSTGDVLMAGERGEDGYIMRLNGTGNSPVINYGHRYFSGNIFIPEIHQYTDVMETQDGNYALMGSFIIPFSFEFNAALIKINSSNGSRIFGKAYTSGLSSILPQGGAANDGGYFMYMTAQQFTGFNYHTIKADQNGDLNNSDCLEATYSPSQNSYTPGFVTPTYTIYNNRASIGALSPALNNITPDVVIDCRTIVCNAPPTPTASADNNNFCPGGSVTISASGSGPNTTYEIFDQASGGNSLGNAPQTFTPNTTTTYYVEAYENSDPLCVTPRDSVTVTVRPDAPNTPGNISGENPVCPGDNEQYSISSVADASSYNWSLNGGGTLTGSGTLVNVNWTTTGTWTISVNAENSCGQSSNQTLQVTVSDPPPAQPGAISGVIDPCPGNQSYSIASVSGATSYDWTLSGGGNISGSGTSIDVDWTSSGGPYTLSVVAENGCGSSAAQTLQVNVKDAAPSSIADISGSDTVCVGAENYNIPAVNGATNYAWTISGGGNIASGQGTNNISINWTTTGTYTINVTAENDCGYIDATPYEVTVLPNAPVTPGNITGPIAVCPGVESYSISAVGGADSYTWTLSSGGNIVSGQGTNSIDVDWGSTTGNFTLSVSANSICGSSNASTLSVDVTSGPPSGLPTISGANPACPGTETYTVSGVTGASTYTWSVDAGGSISSGQGTSNVDINWTNSGGPFTIEVFSENSCGAGDTNTLAVFVDSIPEFDGDTIVGAIEICPGTENYSIGSVSNANSYNWTLSGGGSIASGQGSNSISVDWTTSGGPYTLSVEPVNDCGSGSAVTQNINVLPGPPSTPPSITGEVTICEGSGTELYVVETVPNATDYVWTMLNGGGTIVSGQGTDSILIDWTGSPGNYQFSVRAENSCGFSAEINHSVNIIAGAPAQPLAINGPIEICPGTENYGIASVQDASSYNWTLSAGGNIVSGQGSENIEVNWTTSGGPYTLSVIAENTCGSSSAQNLEVNVLQSPSAPSVNVTANNICEGESTTINASGSSGGNISYQVYDAANGGNFLGNTSLDVNPQNTTTYYVEAVNESGCRYAGGRVPVEVVVLQAPNAPNIEVDNQSVCSGDSAVFTASASSGASINWWSAADGGTLLGTGPEFNTGPATESTTFYVSTTAANGCEQITARASVNLNVLDNPSLSLNTDANNNSIFISEALVATAEPDYYDLYQFFLNEEEVQIDSINTWATSILENGDVISVIARDAGCIGNKAEITITVNDFPNAFTPNGDGRNDIFLEGFDLVIVNRWGQELYKGSDGWDGTFNGKRVAPGTYFYIVKVQDITDKENIIKGSVLVHD